MRRGFASGLGLECGWQCARAWRLSGMCTAGRAQAVPQPALAASGARSVAGTARDLVGELAACVEFAGGWTGGRQGACGLQGGRLYSCMREASCSEGPSVLYFFMLAIRLAGRPYGYDIIFAGSCA